MRKHPARKGIFVTANAVQQVKPSLLPAASRSLKSDKVADVVAGAPEEEVSFEADTVRNAVMNIGEDDILPQPAAAYVPRH